jgi:transcriptional regulator with GAF, ATPase, and Fis domain
MVALVSAKYLSEDPRSTVVRKLQVIAHSVKDPADFTIVGISADIKRVREDSVMGIPSVVFPDAQGFVRMGFAQANRHQDFERIIGNSLALMETLDLVRLVAPTDSTVLIEGETGTGKELIASAIHNLSARRSRPFVKLNCAAIPFDLLESELFGHEKGAFTGAIAQKIGRFETADTGTLFLDEIGDLPQPLQPKLLRVLQEQEFERLGSGRTHRINVRLVAATHRDLTQMVARNEFRSDLYYRLNVFPVVLPPLRERRQDIAPLVSHFVELFARRMGKRIEQISQTTMNAFSEYSWPGNVRELQNVVERSVIVSSDGVFSVDPAWLSKDSRRVSLPQQPKPADADENASRERQIIEDALAGSRGRVSGPDGAAARLRVPPSTLENRIKKLRIHKSHFKLS